MKKRILLILFAIGLLFFAIVGTEALTTSSESLEESDMIESTRVERGHYYTLRDYKGDLLHSPNYEFGDGGIGMFKFRDTNNNVLLCAQLGTQFGKGVTSISEVTYDGTGPACGLLKSLSGDDTSFKIGKQSYSDGTLTEEDISISLTPADISNYKTSDTSFVKVQRVIWKYQGYTGTCYDKAGNILSDYKVISDRQNITFSLPKAFSNFIP